MKMYFLIAVISFVLFSGNFWGLSGLSLPFSILKTSTMEYYTMNTVGGCSCFVSCALNHKSWASVHAAYYLALPLSQPSASPL